MPSRCRLLALVSFAALSSTALHATDFTLADGEVKGTLKTRVVAGAGVRLNDPSKHLVGKGFRSDGKPKGGDGADTADDGNLNYGKGDVYSSLFKVVSSLDLQYKNVGIAASARAWYDNTLEKKDVPQGSGASAFAANRPLDDHGLSKANHFSGFMWLNAYAYGHFAMGDESALDVRVGKQTVKWGEGLFLQGINQVNPTDYTTLHRPGTDPVTEAQLPVEMLWGKVTIDDHWSAEAFWQWKWRPSELDPCGTFFAGTDLGIDPGCGGIESNAYYPINAYSPGAGQWLSDGYQYSVGGVLPRYANIDGKNSGQYGATLRYAFDRPATYLAAYYLRYNSRNPILDATTIDPSIQDNSLVPKLLAAGAPLSDAQLSARLSSIHVLWEYPNDIRLFGLSGSTMLGGWKLGGELSYTKDLPVQINTADMFAALTRSGGPIGARNTTTAPGGVLYGFDRYDRTQLLLNTTHAFKDVLGAQTATFAAEAVYSHTDLPSLADVRYGRGFHWGFSTELNGGGCPAIQNPAGCRNGGYYTRDAWGWRAKGTLNYTVGRWLLSPSLGLGQDVHGYSVDSQLVGGRKQVSAGFSATLDKTWFANLTYTNYLGHQTYDTLADHDFATLSFGANF
ncbi:DUF1302 domain-containing protein [Luteibacter yeojuensis]|uniref:DUF1302 domain-containing protein n=1 Tax=Luteibacter yeojuensis TaxID=345309 RepID=A0A0F3L4J8_9GAMM|nr:DUF1302 domain-containing protein [Luteibacter yeojuensis]KJV37284.1 hypothetical protein VI08_00225 [Luteibacter yeojuensis]